MASTDHFACDSQVWSVIDANKDNLTALRTLDAPPWVSTSRFRGTMSILQSCILTLVASVYTAIHLNVPEKHDWLSLLLTKAQWVLLALLAPEIVLYSAASQFLEAFTFRKRIRELQAQSDTVDKKFKFTLKYAFFVVMGGFHIEQSRIAHFLSRPDVDRDSEWGEMSTTEREALLFAQESSVSFPLKPQGVLDLCNYGCWVYIPTTKIDARSKADQIQKALVLLQVSWLALQCIARRAYGLPLTLLEVHTMIHVACAVILYVLWFEKPLDVSDPEMIYKPSWDNTLALLVQKTIYNTDIGWLRKYHIPDNVQLFEPSDPYASYRGMG
ncbi:hypothetical protein CJF30_00011210 [Rutstroemia sp. NJR-2017a BBW]|nr:hypothetical protein CJF30_00011210 [Rutstroemia sp. NJR-2017a BBW]